MIREIRKKLLIIQGRRPFSDEASRYIEETEEEIWVNMNLRLEGSILSDEDVSRALSDECLRNININDYLMIDNIRELRRFIYEEAYSPNLNGKPLRKNTLDKIYSIVSGNSNINYRRNNPVLIKLKYNPPFAQEISGKLDEVFRELYLSDDFFEVIYRAARLHNQIIEIYPYRDYNLIVARASMFYYLVQNGLPLCNLLFTESEYYNEIIEYLKDGNSGILEENLLRGIYNKLDLVMQVTDYES